MDEIAERVAYLQGLVRGIGEREAGPVAPVVQGILEVLADVVDSLAEVKAQQADLAEIVAAEGQGDVWWTFTCPTCGARIDVADEVFDDEGHVELVCPQCGTLVHDGDDHLAPAPDDGEVSSQA